MGEEVFYELYPHSLDDLLTDQFVSVGRLFFIFIGPLLSLTYGYVLVGAQLEKVRRDTASEVATRAKADDAQIHLREKEEFIHYLSHEIRNSLNVIAANIDYYLADDDAKHVGLENGQQTGENQRLVERLVEVPRDVMEDMAFSSTIASRVVGDVLTLETMKKRNIFLEMAPFRVEETVKKSLRFFKNKSLEKNIELKVTHEGGVIPNLMGDSERLGQVLTNFVSNAIKFTSEGEIHMKYGIRDDDYLFISVTDTGIGISESDARTLFRPFRQLRAGEANPEGSGLGLAICKKIVNLHGGDVGVVSEEGKGSTFWLRIKAVKVLCGVEKELTDSIVSGSSCEKSHCTNSVLVVEDSHVLAKVLIRMVGKLGVRDIKHAKDGKEAADIFERGETFDLVFMDHEMPRLSGSDATRVIRRSGFTGKIIGVTGNASEEQQKAFLGAGLDEIIVKPICIKVLRNCL